MKWGLYNVLFAAVYPFLLPGFLVRMLKRGGYAARMGDRFALYPDGLFGRNRPLYDSHAPKSGNRTIEKSEQSSNRTIEQSNNSFVWIHAVSVGEVQVAGQLMREWRAAEPGVRFCFSTTSSTGWKMAEREVKAGGEGDGDVLIYNPLDFPNFVKSALRTVRPRAIVLTESEIWPNFILQAKKMGVPIFLINARVSDRSAPRYKLAKWWFGDVLSSFTRIFAQSDLDKARLVAAGASDGKVEVTGSFKFDVARRNEAKEKELRAWIFGDGDVPEVRTKILLGGSTWPGEDEVLLKIYRRLGDSRTVEQSNSRTPLLVIAPRHFEKADAIEANIRKAGFACVRRSRGEGRETSDVGRQTEPGTRDVGRPPVYLADTTGELMGLYGIADAVFVGKSLCAHGSQNMIEPCLCGKPTFVGPYTENFRPVMSDLLASDAIVQVKDAAELETEVVKAMQADGPSELGLRAREAVERRRGVVARCVREIREVL